MILHNTAKAFIPLVYYADIITLTLLEISLTL